MTRILAGDFDYDSNGRGYAEQRRPDPRIAAMILDALGDARTVLNVGAGAGSYEPVDRYVVAVEPSAGMRAQRPPDRVPALDATAERLPFDDGSFDAVLATVTVHQWADPAGGLAQLRRVARGPVVVLTFYGDALDLLWLADYPPELVTAERRRLGREARAPAHPAVVRRVAAAAGGSSMRAFLRSLPVFDGTFDVRGYGPRKPGLWATTTSLS